MFVLINTFKNMVVKFVGACSVATAIIRLLFILCLKFTVLPMYVVLLLQELHQLYPLDVMKLEHSCVMRINYSGNLYIHSNTNHTFQKYNFELLVYSTNAISF